MLFHKVRQELTFCDKVILKRNLDPFLFCLAQLITIMPNNNLFNILASQNLGKYFVVYYDKFI